MINDLDIVQWAYLLDPAFQIVNTAGKPLTDGWIEVYIHGTRNKYYCASDFDGTLHPFKIPLDSLGANIVLASPDYAYDIYIYNKFGSLVMSRYNVVAGKGGGGSGGIPSSTEAEHWLGQYGATQALNGNETGQTLALPSRPDYHGDFVDRIDYGTINGDETNQYPKYMYLKPGLYLVNCVIRFQQRSGTEVNRLDELLVYTGNGNANEDVAWQLDETGPLTDGDCRHCLKMTFIRKVLDTGETSTVDCSNILYFAPAPSVNWSDAYIQTLQIVKLGAGFGSTSYASGGVEYKAGPGISIDIYNNISVTGMQPASSMGDYVTYEVYNEFVNNVTGDVTNISNTVNNVTGDIQNITEIVNNVTGDVHNYDEVINNVTGDIEQLNIDIQTVSAAIPTGFTQVNSDWAATGGVAEILNKPVEIPLIAGANISIVETANGLVISSQGGGSVTGNFVTEEELQAAIESVTGMIPDVSDFVTHDELAGVTGDYATNTDLQTVSAAVDTVSASIPESEEVEFEELDLSQFAQASAVTGLEAQIQEVSSAIPDVSEITNVINNVTGDVQNLTTIVENVTGDINNLETIVNNVTGDINVLETNISGVTGDISQIETDIQTVSSAVDSVSAQIPESKEVEFIELDISNFATNSQVTGLEAEIQAVSAGIPAAQVQSDWNQSATGEPDYIKNKPAEVNLIPGEGISITASGDDFVISSNATGDYVTHDELATEISTVTGMIPDVSDLATEAELQAVSAAIPPEQVNADWNAVAGKAQILNKPAIETIQAYELVAGANVSITEVSGQYIISATGGGSVTGDYATHAELAQVEADVQTVSAAIPDVSNLATNSDLQTVSGAVDEVSGLIPESEEVEFEELDLSQFVTESAVTGLETQIQTVSAAIPDISGLATEADLQTVSAAIPDVSNLATNADLQTVSAAIPDVSNLATKAEVEAAVDTVTGMIPDVSNLATESDLQTVSGAVDSVSASIPESEEVEFEELDLSQYVTESAVTGLEAEIQTVSAAIPDVSSFATESDLQTVSAKVDEVSGSIPSQIEVEFKELDLSQFVTESAVTGLEADIQTVSAAIPDTSNLATEADLQTVSAAIPDVSNLATKTEVSTASGNAVISANGYTDSAVSGLQNKLTGITDVVVTNSLPASPVATVLYLIPEA